MQESRRLTFAHPAAQPTTSTQRRKEDRGDKCIHEFGTSCISYVDADVVIQRNTERNDAESPVSEVHYTQRAGRISAWGCVTQAAVYVGSILAVGYERTSLLATDLELFLLPPVRKSITIRTLLFLEKESLRRSSSH